MGNEKKIRKINLSQTTELKDFSISVNDLLKFQQHNAYLKKIDNEQYKQISMNCLTNKSMKHTTDKVSSEFPLKVFFVFFTVLLTYYSIYYIAYIYIKNSLDIIYYYVGLFTIISITLLLFVLFIYRKDFGKVQLFIYSGIYMIFSLLGVLTLVLNLFPITPYQVINLFIIILFIQTLIFVITVPITRKLVCRIDRRSYNVETIDL